MTDPAALPAFFEAGGGVISNAIAGGADALSDNALLPAAYVLRGLEGTELSAGGRVAAPAPYDPFAYTPAQFQGPQPPPVAAPWAATAAAQLPPPVDGLGDLRGLIPGTLFDRNRVVERTPTGQQSVSETTGRPITGSMALLREANRRLLNSPDNTGLPPVIGAAQGFDGLVDEPTVFVAGEMRSPGRCSPDQVQDPRWRRQLIGRSSAPRGASGRAWTRPLQSPAGTSLPGSACSHLPFRGAIWPLSSRGTEFRWRT